MDVLSHSCIASNAAVHAYQLMIKTVQRSCAATDLETRPIQFAEGAGTDFAQDFERNVMERMEVATAQAIVSAISSATEAGEMCNLNLRICAATSKCAERNAICRGPGVDGIIPCCVSDQQCVRRTETESRCRTSNTTLPSFFLGGPTEFPVCAPEIDM